MIDIKSGSPPTGTLESSDQTLERIMREKRVDSGSPPTNLPIRNQEQTTDSIGKGGYPPTPNSESTVTQRQSRATAVAPVNSESVVAREAIASSVHAGEESASDSMLKMVEDRLKDCPTS